MKKAPLVITFVVTILVLSLITYFHKDMSTHIGSTTTAGVLVAFNTHRESLPKAYESVLLDQVAQDHADTLTLNSAVQGNQEMSDETQGYLQQHNVGYKSYYEISIPHVPSSDDLVGMLNNEPDATVQNIVLNPDTLEIGIGISPERNYRAYNPNSGAYNAQQTYSTIDIIVVDPTL